MSAGAATAGSEAATPHATRRMRVVTRAAQKGRVPADDFGVVTAEDADGGLRLSLFGRADSRSTSLRDIVIAALQSEPPRVEVELSGVTELDEEAASFLVACGRMARLMGVEFRLTRADGQVAAALAAATA